MKLKQIKPFQKENITQEIAANLVSLFALNRYWKSKEMIEEGFTIEESYHGVKIGGGGSQYAPHLWNNPEYKLEGYSREFHSITITPNKRPFLKVTVWADGRGQAMYNFKKGDIKSSYSGYKEKGIPPSVEYYDKDTSHIEYPPDPIEVVQYYLDNGFFTIE